MTDRVYSSGPFSRLHSHRGERSNTGTLLMPNRTRRPAVFL